jgi:hypothetical protein
LLSHARSNGCNCLRAAVAGIHELSADGLALSNPRTTNTTT